jgi:hypothetical protein
MPVAKELTELIEINPTRVDLVKTPASGFPILLMKSVAQESATGRDTDTGDPAPMPEPASKDTGATDTPPAATPETTDAPAEKSAEDFTEAIAKAVEPLQEVIKGLREEMAALKATPIPGAPVVTSTAVKDTAKESAVAKEIARFERLAGNTQDRELARYYADRVKELKGN